MPLWSANCLLVPVILLMVSVSQSAARAELTPQPEFIGPPPAPVIIGLPEPSRFRPGDLIRQADGKLAYVAALIQMDMLPPLPAIAAWLNAPGTYRARQSALRAAFEPLVRERAAQYGLDPDLVLTIIAAESGFRADAVSPRGAIGLMQLMPATARRFGVRDSNDPVQNLEGGMSYLRWLLSYFRGNVKLALAAYNAGEHKVERYEGIPPYAETQSYVMKITRDYPKTTHPFDPELTQASPLVVRPKEWF